MKGKLDERIKWSSRGNMHSLFLDKLPALRYIIHIYDKKLPPSQWRRGEGRKNDTFLVSTNIAAHLPADLLLAEPVFSSPCMLIPVAPASSAAPCLLHHLCVSS